MTDTVIDGSKDGVFTITGNEVIKAGCILIDKNNQKLALVYREDNDDYSFPKGHLEKEESIIECAIRETYHQIIE